jgi:RNA polymerase sigma-70 factor (ECF subfamily)
VDERSEAVVEVNPCGARFDLDSIFHAQYERIARVIACVIRDPARAEELAVEVFLKWSREPKAQGEKAEGWLYRTAVRMGQNELRRQTRRSRYETLFGLFRGSPTTPEELLSGRQEEEKVRVVLSVIESRHAELLLLRGQGLSYDELASALDLNPRSVGTFLSRAQQAFRKEYIRLYERGRHGKE